MSQRRSLKSSAIDQYENALATKQMSNLQRMKILRGRKTIILAFLEKCCMA